MNGHVLAVACEQFNVNDDSYKITDVMVKPGQPVKKGELVMVLDSSKASYDIHTEKEGVFYTAFQPGDFVGVNEPMYLLLTAFEESQQAAYDA